jgi:hypothetical protein
MRIVGCSLGWLLVLAALAVAGWELLAPDPVVGLHLRPAGELWFRLNVGSLNLMQAVVERYIWPPLWDPGVVSILQLPALLVFAVPGLVLLIVCHGRRGLRRRRWRWRFK